MEYLLEFCVFQVVIGLLCSLKASALECYQCHYFEGSSSVDDERVQEFLDVAYELTGSEVCHNTGTNIPKTPSIIVSCDVPRGDYQPFCKKTHAVITTTFHEKELKIDAWTRGCVIVPKGQPFQLGCTTNMTGYKTQLEIHPFKNYELELKGRTCYCDSNQCNKAQPAATPSAAFMILLSSVMALHPALLYQFS